MFFCCVVWVYILGLELSDKEMVFYSLKKGLFVINVMGVLGGMGLAWVVEL